MNFWDHFSSVCKEPAGRFMMLALSTGFVLAEHDVAENRADHIHTGDKLRDGAGHKSGFGQGSVLMTPAESADTEHGRRKLQQPTKQQCDQNQGRQGVACVLTANHNHDQCKNEDQYR